MNKNTTLIGVIVAAVLIAGAVVYTNYTKCLESKQVLTNTISSQEAGEKLVEFVNKNLLKGQATASLIESLEDGDFYKIKFKVQEQEVEWRITKDGRFVFPDTIDLAEVKEPAEEIEKTEGNFSVSSDEVCKEGDKPIVYFFGSTGCPHCAWEHPIIEEAAAKFGDKISFHNNMDSKADEEVFGKYNSTGGIPTLVLGCKYYRVGSGESLGEKEEVKVLTGLICELTDNQPGDVCEK